MSAWLKKLGTTAIFPSSMVLYAEDGNNRELDSLLRVACNVDGRRVKR